jgi:ferric-dicitrate binding protein FerR (iron transport regulator)
VESANIEKHVSWKDGKLVFKNDPVAEIAKKLARWYHVEVDVTDQKVHKYTFTATFTDETLPQVLELLSMPTPVVYNLIPREKLTDVHIAKQKVVVGLKKQNL